MPSFLSSSLCVSRLDEWPLSHGDMVLNEGLGLHFPRLASIVTRVMMEVFQAAALALSKRLWCQKASDCVQHHLSFLQHGLQVHLGGVLVAHLLQPLTLFMKTAALQDNDFAVDRPHLHQSKMISAVEFSLIWLQGLRAHFYVWVILLLFFLAENNGLELLMRILILALQVCCAVNGWGNQTLLTDSFSHRNFIRVVRYRSISLANGFIFQMFDCITSALSPSRIFYDELDSIPLLRILQRWRQASHLRFIISSSDTKADRDLASESHGLHTFDCLWPNLHLFILRVPHLLGNFVELGGLVLDPRWRRRTIAERVLLLFESFDEWLAWLEGCPGPLERAWLFIAFAAGCCGRLHHLLRWWLLRMPFVLGLIHPLDVHVLSHLPYFLHISAQMLKIDRLFVCFSCVKQVPAVVLLAIRFLLSWQVSIWLWYCVIWLN